MRPLLLVVLAAMTLGACVSMPAPRSRPAALFVHGWASDARVWTSTRERLASPGVVLNLPGQGVPPTHGDISLEGFALAMERARADAGAPCVVIVAHSNGSYAAFEYTRRYPERVASLIIIEGTFRLPFTNSDAFRAQIAEVGARWPSIQESPLGLSGAHPATIETVRQMFADTSRDSATRSLEALLTMAPADQQRIVEPVHFIIAESPFWSETELNALGTIAPQSRVTTIAGASHWLPLDEPEAIAHAVEQEVQGAQCAALRVNSREG